MGWMYTEKGSSTSVKEFFEKEFGGPYTRVVDCAVVGLRTAYLALESSADSSGEAVVFAVVCLLDYRRGDSMYNFGYKNISEEMGPVEDECPERILEMLSPTTYEYALDWRKRCRQRIERRKSRPSLKTGYHLVLENPVKFADGRSRDVFYIADAKRRRFIARDGMRCKIPRSVLEDTGYSVHEQEPVTAR